MRGVLPALSLVAALAGVALAADMVDDPYYKGWSSFKKDSWVKFETTGVGKSWRTEKLLEVTPEQVTVEMTTEMPPIKAGEKEIPISPTVIKQEFKAKRESTKDDPRAPKPTEGDEELDIAGKKMKCHYTAVKGEGYESKFWTSDEVPGHVIKRWSKSGTTETTTVAIKWEKK